jgi:hypothetical protein
MSLLPSDWAVHRGGALAPKLIAAALALTGPWLTRAVSDVMDDDLVATDLIEDQVGVCHDR